MQDLKLDLVFIFINLDKMQMDDIYQSLNYLLNVFRTYKIQSKIVFISYCLNSSDSVFTNFLGLKNSFNQYMFNEIIIFSEKNYEKSKKFYNQLLQIIKQ